VTLDLGDIMLRVALAAALGTAVGFEREIHGQLAGMRTHALVATGAALFTLVGAYGFRNGFGDASIDPTRVAAQIVSGIGFIGAGAILRDQGSVRGVTTAAALWATAALGMAAAAGEFSIALTGLLVIAVALIGLRVLRERGPLSIVRRTHAIDIAYQRGHGTLAPIITAIASAGASLQRLAIDDDDTGRHVHLVVRARHHADLHTQLDAVAELPEVFDMVYRTRT
jgi:putative Mg2+ transporter-C (MgtC) family protein